MQCDLLWLDSLHCTNNVIRIETLNVDGHGKREKMDEMIHIFVGLARLHPSEEGHDNCANILFKIRSLQLSIEWLHRFIERVRTGECSVRPTAKVRSPKHHSILMG